MLRTLPCALLCCATLLACDASPNASSGSRKVEPKKALTRIAFGSCANQERPQPIWEAIRRTDPQLMLLLGDNIYADTTDMRVMKAKYDKFAAVEGYAKLRKDVPVLATWDDHDLGANDAGANYPKRAEAQKLFLDFFGDAADSPRRSRQGVYDAHVFGPEGRRVQVILLDTRYHRSDLKSASPPRRMFAPNDPKADKDGFIYVPATGGRYVPDEDPAKTMLGEEQWAWLEEQLRVPADVRLLVSSIQVIADEHGWEKWDNFPRERRRLYQLIRDAGATGVIVLSGDRHRAEICRADDTGIGYPLWDITSSALNVPSKPDKQNEPNTKRVGPNYIDANFGLLTIDWKARTVTAEVRDVAGNVVLSQAIPLAGLAPSAEPATTRPATADE